MASQLDKPISQRSASGQPADIATFAAALIQKKKN
jgi:hypothetical protein